MSNPDAHAELLQKVKDIQQEHYEQTGEWKSEIEIINEMEFDSNVELSMDDDSDNK
jgi:ribosome maturation protein Sdo1